MIKILDIGCRYGVFPRFKHCLEEFEYFGVDADVSEIQRLKKKYHNHKKISLFNCFLGSKNKKIIFNIHKHKGYSTSKKINPKSLWFGLIRKNEKSIKQKKKIYSFKSSDWINKNIKGKLILKLDIEGGELDFLKGLTKKNFNNIQAIVAETHFENPFQSESNFGTIFNYLTKKGYWLANLELHNEELSIFSNETDKIPHSATSIFLKKSYSPIKHDSSELEIKCETLYALKLNSLLIEYLKSQGYKKIKDIVIFDKIKFVCGHIFNNLKKRSFTTYYSLNKDYKKIFRNNLPKNSDFFENNFYNPD